MLHSGGKKSGYSLYENFNEAEFKSNELICLEKETSRYPSIQVTAWVVLIAFSLLYSKNSKQKTEKNM